VIKKIKYILFGVFVYQIIAIVLLNHSNYLNVISYYTHPPYLGDVELRRLPMIFGEPIALAILERRKEDAVKLAKNRTIGIAAILSSYQHEQVLSQNEARDKTFVIAELFITSGYNLELCENEGESVASVLKRWGVYDSKMETFLLKFLSKEQLFICKEQ